MDVEADPQSVTRRIMEQRLQTKRIGVVPTMGALHEGHLSLVRTAREDCEFVVVTIFVNPTQFGPTEDFDRYPRTLETDLELCRAAGADLVFTPDIQDMYPVGSQTVVTVDRLTTTLEGDARPGHFDGVTTIVAKLFHVTLPDRAYFGQKDYQQQLVLRRMVTDLLFPLEIVTCATIREPDGLAMSSRNRYLTVEERRTALSISQALVSAGNMAAQGKSSPDDISAAMQSTLRQTPGLELEYAVIVDGESLEPLQNRNSPAVALIAARVGTTRLIDNAILQFR